MRKSIIASAVACLLLIVCLAPTASATLIPDNPAGTTLNELAAEDSMSTNNGTINRLYGALTNNSGSVLYMYSGTLGTNNGDVYDMTGGTLTTNNGTIEWVDDGTVVENATDGRISTVYRDGMVYGTVTTNNGTIETNQGEVGTNNGTITDNYGTIGSNTGIITNNWGGTVTSNTGTIVNQYYPITMTQSNSAAVIGATVNYDTAYLKSSSTNVFLVASAGFQFINDPAAPSATGCTLTRIDDTKYSITDITGPVTITAYTESVTSGQFWVGGTPVTGTASGEGWSYDSSSNTLTLNNAHISDFHYGTITDFNNNEISSRAIIYDSRDTGLNIVLQGNNELAEDVLGLNYAIYVKGNLSISGNGLLHAATNGRSSVGIWSGGQLSVTGGTISVSGCTVAIGSKGNASFTGGTIGAEVDRGSQSIFIRNGNLAIDGAAISSEGNTFDIYVAGGNFTMASGSLNLARSGCLDVNGSVTITDGMIMSNAKGRYAVGVIGNGSPGSDTFTMSGGNILVSGMKADQLIVDAGSYVLSGGVEITNLTPKKYDEGQGKFVPCELGEARRLYSTTEGSGSIGVGLSGFTVLYDANGGTGTMSPGLNVTGEYTLLPNGFTPPAGKMFKCWLIGETEKNPGEKINVTANVTVKASWKDAPAPEPEYTHKDVGGKEVYSNEVTSGTDTNVTGIFTAAKAASGVVDVKVGTMNITFDSDAVTAIGGKTVSLKAEMKTSGLDVDGAKAVIEVTLDGATFANGKATVTVPFTESVPDGKVLKVYFINGTEKTAVDATLEDGKVVFTTNHFSKYAVVFEDASSPSGDNGNGGFPWWIIGVVVGVVAVAGIAAFFILKKH